MVEDGTPSNGTQAMLQREMAEAVVRAQKTVNRYTHRKAQLALHGYAPEGSPSLREQLTEAHSAVLNAFQLMREYIQYDVDGIWNENVIGYYRGDPVLFGAPPPEVVADGGVKQEQNGLPENATFLSEFHNAIERELVEERGRFEQRATLRERVHPKLLDIDAYQSAVDCLMYALKDTKFAPQAGLKDVEEREPLLFDDQDDEERPEVEAD